MKPCSILLAAVLAAAAGLAAPAGAWGPHTESAIINTAMHIWSKQTSTPLAKLEKDVRNGAMASNEILRAHYPDLEVNPIGAIESEMYLLRAVQSGNIDAYFAYRLGMLAKVVVNLTAPLTQSDPNYADLYYADVEERINKLSVKPAPRSPVEPRAYFARRTAEANVNSALIVEQYKNGIGFDGVAATTLEQDASRCANAVADVWQAILSAPAAVGSVSDAQLRTYVLGAYEYFIKRGNLTDILAAAKRLDAITPRTADLAVAIGDLYYAAAFYEQAMNEYKTSLDLSPGRRDVMEKISEYYVTLGERALADKRLEDALDAFKTAVDTNPLHPTAEAQRLETARLIADRDARRHESGERLQRAAQLENLANTEAARQRYAEAVVLLREAEATYASVTDEFPPEYQQALAGLRNVDVRMNEYKRALLENVQLFSGAGFLGDAQAMAARDAHKLDEATLRALLQARMRRHLGELESRLAPKMQIE